MTKVNMITMCTYNLPTKSSQQGISIGKEIMKNIISHKTLCTIKYFLNYMLSPQCVMCNAQNHTLSPKLDTDILVMDTATKLSGQCTTTCNAVQNEIVHCQFLRCFTCTYHFLLLHGLVVKNNNGTFVQHSYHVHLIN